MFANADYTLIYTREFSFSSLLKDNWKFYIVAFRSLSSWEIELSIECWAVAETSVIVSTYSMGRGESIFVIL